MTKRILCTLCAGLLAGSVLTACGTDPANVADTEISDLIQEETAPPEITAEITAETTETSPAETDTTDAAAETVPEDDFAEARRVLEQYLDSIVSGDLDAMLESSNIELFLSLWGGVYTEETLDELRGEMSEMAEPEMTYEIGAGREAADMLAEYNETVQETCSSFLEYAKKNEEVYSAEILARMRSLMQPIETLLVFPVTGFEDGAELFTDDVYVLRLEGKWIVDIVMTEGLLHYDFADDTEPEPEPEPEETRKEIVIPEPVTLTDADINEARNVLAKCLTYQNQCDLSGLRKISNFEAMMLGSVGISLSGSDLGLLERIMSEADDYTYKIAPGKSVPEKLAQYNAREKELLESEKFAKLPEKYKEQDVNMMRHFLKPAQALCEFPVTFSYADGTDSAETWYVLMIDGEWVVDFGIVDNGLANQED